MNNVESGYSQAELRFFLPLVPGQAVGVLGGSKKLRDSLVSEGFFVSNIPTTENLALGSNETGNSINDLDHVIIPEYFPNSYGLSISSIVQHLKPGGWLLLGIHNSEALYHVFSKKRSSGQSRISLGKCKHLLYQNGLRIVRFYGAYDMLEHPEVLVPLDTGEATHFFYRNIFVPATRFAAWTLPVAALLATIRLQRMLFRDLVIIARRTSGGNNDI
jgi:hypothetical protein